ncbi:MAG: hypothetical protein AAF665_02970 [Pseudomonadota bacterium]
MDFAVAPRELFDAGLPNGHYANKADTQALTKDVLVGRDLRSIGIASSVKHVGMADHYANDLAVKAHDNNRRAIRCLVSTGLPVALATAFRGASAYRIPFAAIGALGALVLSGPDTVRFFGTAPLANQSMGFGFLNPQIDSVTTALS